VFINPTCVSIPKDNGMTSIRNTSLFELPERTEAGIAAPIETA